MYLEVYPDVIFILNFLIDFILLSLLKKINRRNSSIKRRILAAAIGAVSAVIVSIFPGMNMILRFIFMNIITSVLMLSIAFGRLKQTDLAKQIVTLYLITYFAGGLINSVYYNTNIRITLIHLGNLQIFQSISWKFVAFFILLMLPATFLLLWVLRLINSSDRETLEVELILNGRNIRTKGLMDTGNCLYEPIFRKPVIIMENSLLEGLLSADCRKELDTAKKYLKGSIADSGSENIRGDLLHLKFIPYQSVGEPQGMMLGLVLDKLLIFKGKETVCNEKVTAAICDNHLSTKEEYHVILHKELI